MRQAIDADGSGTLHVTELVQALRQRHVVLIGVYIRGHVASKMGM